MMKIKKIAIGNKLESFIEDRLNDGVNIIYSDDNNKGKTIVIQGLMYALGNDPIFPMGFRPNEYYFYVEIEVNSKIIEFLRHKSTTLVKLDSKIYVFETSTELKYFINENILQVPQIIKDGQAKLVDLGLLYEIFFVGQDKRNTSNTINTGYYNKKDFENLLSSMNGNLLIDISDEQKNKKEEIQKIKSEIATTKKLLKLTKENYNLSGWINKYDDSVNIEELKNDLKTANDTLSEYTRKRKNEINRKNQLENLITELNSLNREISKGKIICKNCGSTQIIYTNNEIAFDISNVTVRMKILESIHSQIGLKEKLIYEYSENINNLKDKIKKILKDIPDEFQAILLYKEEILSEEEYDNKLTQLNNQLIEIKRSAVKNEENDKIAKENYKNLKKEIIDKMNYYYKYIDRNGKLIFNDLFTLKNATYSGSDEQEYYFSRTLAISECLKHQFPIIMDYYRGGEISTNRENLMIDCYKSLNKQVIITSTLKEQEYSVDKYKDIDGINVIDYSFNEDSKILTSKHNNEFKNIVENLGIVLE